MSTDDFLARERLLIGDEAVALLSGARVAVFGLGGVGSFAAEALARAGVGALDLIDGDSVAVSNLNRQLFALRSTVGTLKTDAAGSRISDINPDCVVRKYSFYFGPGNSDGFDFSSYSYVVDAVDSVTAKLELAVRCAAAGTPLISAMGAGNKLDPTSFEVADIFETKMCPLARVMRRELKKRGIDSLKVVYSPEPPIAPDRGDAAEDDASLTRKIAPGSVSFVPSVVGLIMAGEVVRDVCGIPG